jgi:hypothetical protein
MNMADGDASSSLSSSSDDEDDDDDDDDAIAPSTTLPPAPLVAATATTTATTTTKDAAKDASKEYNADIRFPTPALFESPTLTFESPNPIIGTVGTVAVGTSSGSYSSLAAKTTAVAVLAVSLLREKWKSKDKKGASKKAKNNKPKPKPQTAKGSRASPHEIDDGDDNSWQVSMLDIRHGEVDLEVEEWSSQKEQKSMELQLQQEKWRSESKQQNLEYKFDLMVKYKELTEQGFDNHQIVKMIPDMQPIIDMANMPVYLQLSPEEQHDA